MTVAPASRRVSFAPVIIAALLALALLKAAGLWISFSPAGAAEVAAGAATQAAPAAPGPARGSDRLLEQLAARKLELDAREAELDTRAKVIAAAELRVEAAARALQEEKRVIAADEDAASRLKGDEIGALSNAYERMKARDAARIFEVLDDDILLPIAAGMRTQALAGVLAEMAPQKAKALTVALANRGAQTAPAAPDLE